MLIGAWLAWYPDAACGMARFWAWQVVQALDSETPFFLQFSGQGGDFIGDLRVRLQLRHPFGPPHAWVSTLHVPCAVLYVLYMLIGC